MIVDGGPYNLSKREMTRLIKKGMKGDAEAFARIYRVFFNTIYYNVSNSLVNKSETEDAIQQIVLQLHRSLPRLKSPFAFHSYLYRITTNVCNEYNHKETRQRLNSQEEEEEAVDESEMPFEDLERKSRDELVRSFINNLPEKQRYALVLYYFYDMSYKGIAETMGTSVSVVGSNINRAKNKVKQMLVDYENNKAKDKKSGDASKDASLDSVFTAAIAFSIANESVPGSADAIWHKLIEQAPEIAVSTVSLGTQISTLKALLATTLASGAVIGASMLGYMYADRSEEIVEPTTSIVTEAQQSVFIPESVSIDFLSVASEVPELKDSVYAKISLSDGYPLEWYIIDESGTVCAQGKGSVIKYTYFEALQKGDYTIKWTIMNDEGEIGFAYNEFSVVNRPPSL